MRIVETDNFGGDYRNEKFLNLPYLSPAAAERVATAINNELCNCPNAPRFWKVVPNDYVCALGFEP